MLHKIRTFSMKRDILRHFVISTWPENLFMESLAPSRQSSLADEKNEYRNRRGTAGMERSLWKKRSFFHLRFSDFTVKKPHLVDEGGRSTQRHFMKWKRMRKSRGRAKRETRRILTEYYIYLKTGSNK